MKRTRRQVNEIIIWFIFYVILVFVLLYFSLWYLYPKFLIIEEKKKNTENILKNIADIKKYWIDFNSFKKWIKTDDISKKEMLKSIDEDFYKENLTNTWNIDFSIYLNNLESSLFNEKNNKILTERNKKLSKILPSYIEWDRKIYVENKDWDKNWNKEWNENNINILTNFKFINHLELLLNTFNLKYSSSLWISNIVFLDDYWTKWWSSLESNIFYIPLKFNLNWDKRSIINFLYYIEHVWNVEEIIWKNDIKVNTDYDFLSYNWVPLVLEWEFWSMNYNIFEHQIADIESISTSEYLDSSINDRKWESFINFIKNNQWKEDYNIIVEMRFYIKWLPTYELEEWINLIIDKYDELNKNITKKLTNKYIKIDIRNELNKYNSTLKSISSNITKIKKSLIKKEDLEKNYKEALKLDLILKNIENKIK